MGKEEGIVTRGVLMTVQVPDSVRKATTKCAHDFACLKTGKCGDRELCPVDYADGKHVLFLKERKPALCPYRVSFADRQICCCPMHYALCASQP